MAVMPEMKGCSIVYHASNRLHRTVTLIFRRIFCERCYLTEAEVVTVILRFVCTDITVCPKGTR